MPYKEKIRKGKVNTGNKKKRKITNWSEYNKNLKKRGSLTVLIEDGIENKWYALKESKAGRPFQYSDYAITILLTLRLVFNMGLRQVEGFGASLLKFSGIKLKVPDYTRLSRRATTVLKRCNFHEMKESGHVVIDSSGIKVFGESEWLETKHGKQYKRKKWRKIHICVDKNGNIVSSVMTHHVTDDRDCVDELIKKAGVDNIDELLADPGYDGEKIYEKLESHGINPIIPPARGSPSVYGDAISSRQKTVNYINEKGVYAWQNKNNYGRRSKVENTFYRYKEIIGRKLKSRKWGNQEAELHLGCCILNLFSGFGMPTYD